MAIKTHFSQADFVEIVSRYDLGDYQEAKPIVEGTVQSNFLIRTTGGKFVLKYYENRTAQSVAFEANLINYVKRQNFPCAATIRNRQGEAVAVFKGKPLILFEFIEGQNIEGLQPQHCTQIIHVAAQLQNITKRYRPYLRQFRWNYTRALCCDLARSRTDQVGTLNAQKKLSWFEKALSELQLPQSLPKSICHCDFHPSNILFNRGDLVALLDFDDANYTYRTFDLICLIDGWAWPHEGELSLQDARMIAQQYNRARTLNRLEKRYLFDVHKLGILFDGVWFFARGQWQDFHERRKIEYLDALGREEYCEALFG